MAGSPTEYQEGAPRLGPVRKATTEGGGGPVSAITVLSGICAGIVTIWGIELGVVSRNGQNVGVETHGIPPTGDGKDGDKTVGRDLEEGSSVKYPQRSGDSETGDVHQ